MFIRAQTPIPFPSDAEVDRLLAIPTLPPSPLTSLSSPLPQIPSPPLPVSSPLPMSPPPLPIIHTHSLGYRAFMIWLRAKSPFTSHPIPLPSPIVLPRTIASMVMMRAVTPSTYILAPRSETPPSRTPPSGTPPLLPIPLPTSLPPLLLPSTDCRSDVLEVTLPPQKRLCIAPGPRYEIGVSSSAPTARPTRAFRADYGFVGTLDAEIRQGLDREVGYGITYTWDEMDTNEIYGRLDDAQDDKSLISGQLNLLRRDRRCYARMARLMKSEARASRDAWVQSMDASDTTRFEVSVIRTMVLAQQTEIGDLRAANHRRQAQLNVMPPEAEMAKTTMILEQGTEGVFELIQWFERMETVFRIRNCNMENQIKFATCTLLGSALTWWNSHVRTVGHDVAYAMTWTNLKNMMTDKYCPRGEIKKLEVEMWNLKVKGIDVVCSCLPDMIHGSVMASKPKTMQEAIEFAIELMDKKIRTFAERSGEKKPYGGSKPLCSKCNYHYDSQCAPKCYKCNRVGHLARDCRSTANANTTNRQRGTRAVGNGNAPAKLYAVGHAGTNPNSNVVMGMFLLNNRYASILFNIGADRSFVSTAFSSQIDITPTTLDHY
ncbi:reverse transcriptase domain-containing protein [Tanacetum coccineum]